MNQEYEPIEIFFVYLILRPLKSETTRNAGQIRARLTKITMIATSVNTLRISWKVSKPYALKFLKNKGNFRKNFG
jgi:hypothetical protein